MLYCIQWKFMYEILLDGGKEISGFDDLRKKKNVFLFDKSVVSFARSDFSKLCFLS